MSKKVKLDDLVSEFEERSKDAVSSNRKYWEGTDSDDVYNVDIHVWRTTGMGNSLQTVVGNKLSIMTAIASLLTTLVNKEVLTEDDIDTIVKCRRG